MFTPNYSYPWANYGSQSTAQTQMQQQTGIIWVQGETGAKSYLLAPGQSALLMDSEANVFYIKSSDASGMPMPLRIFDYTERVVAKNETPAPAPKADYVTREEFEKVIAELKDGQRSVPAV